MQPTLPVPTSILSCARPPNFSGSVTGASTAPLQDIIVIGRNQRNNLNGFVNLKLN
jgi:hypothetical protein